MALGVAVSWYPGLDKSLMNALRSSSDDELVAVWGNISREANEIGSYVDPHVHIPLRDENRDKLPASTMSELQDFMYSEDDGSVDASRQSEGIDSSSEEAHRNSDLDAQSWLAQLSSRSRLISTYLSLLSSSQILLPRSHLPRSQSWQSCSRSRPLPSQKTPSSRLRIKPRQTLPLPK